MKRAALLYGAAAAMLGTTLVAKHAAEQRPSDRLLAPLASIPTRLGSWTAGADLEITDGILSRLRPSDVIGRKYNKAGQELELFVAYYAQQRAGESMHSPKNCLPGSGWEIWKLGSAKIPFEGRPVEVNRFSIQNAGQRMVMIYWYQSRQRIIASEYAAKLLLVRDALLDGRTGGSIVRITVPDEPHALDAALEFAGLIMPEVQRSIGR
jgi:EpsI family protein